MTDEKISNVNSSGSEVSAEELMKKFPNDDFIYVADQGHCPYGTKTEEEIIECVLNVGKYKNSVS